MTICPDSLYVTVHNCIFTVVTAVEEVMPGFWRVRNAATLEEFIAESCRLRRLPDDEPPAVSVPPRPS